MPALVDSLARALLLGAVAIASALAGCTSDGPGEADSDRDGLADADELGGWVIMIERADGNETRTVTSDPNRPDSDGDELSDLQEFEKGGDPREVDTDADGLLDGRGMRVIDESDLGEAFREWGIRHDPAIADRWLGEGDFCLEFGGLAPWKWDSDKPFADGISDADELLGWDVTIGGETRLVHSSACVTDSDADGLKDGDEKARGTDPTQKDTDDDGAWDFVDADPLADIGLRAIVERVRLAEAPPAGATLRVTINVGGREESTDRPARAGESVVDASVTSNVGDAGSPLERSLPVAVIVRVSLVVDGVARALDVTGEGSLLDSKFEVVRGEWLHAGAKGMGPLEVSGPDGSLVVSYARADF